MAKLMATEAGQNSKTKCKSGLLFRSRLAKMTYKRVMTYSNKTSFSMISL